MITKVAVLTFVLVAAAVATSASQSTDTALARRVDILDAMVANLQKRVGELERQSIPGTRQPEKITSLAPPSAAVGKEGWRGLSKGMSMQDVQALLGEPNRVEAGFFTTWYYPRAGSVAFDNSDRVSSWSEPR
jgi:outer membrane protein assembly factor BamE (lipoprotein component of BamABCDE complex)